MATYTYAATDLLTGKTLADDLPLTVQSFGAQLNGGGTLTGSLALSQNYAINAPFLSAVECRRAVLWALVDGYPMWVGVVWDWPDMSRSAGTLPISAQTIDSVWSHRLITDTLEYPQVDLYTSFMDLAAYGQTKHSPYIEAGVSPPATRNAAYLAQVKASGGVARLVLPTGQTSGVPWTASYTYSDLTQVSSAWSDMTASGALEYVFVPGLDVNGNLAIYLQLSYQQLGRAPGECGYSLLYPGNVSDYGYQRTGSQSSNMVWATAPPNGSALQWQSGYPHGANLPDLAAGYPLMESTVSWDGSFVTSQAQINSFADGQAALVAEAMTLPTINVAAGQYPALRDIVLGDSVPFAATSPLHPPGAGGAPGLQTQVRVTGWTCYPPGAEQSEYYQLTTSGVLASTT